MGGLQSTSIVLTLTTVSKETVIHHQEQRLKPPRACGEATWKLLRAPRLQLLNRKDSDRSLSRGESKCSQMDTTEGHEIDFLSRSDN